MACETCRNPVSPVYSKARPIVNIGYVSCPRPNSSFFEISGGESKNVVLIEGQEIDITDLSNQAEFKFLIDHLANVDLSVESFALVSKIVDVIETQPVLWGKTIDEIQLDWTYNKAINNQSLSNNGGLFVPALDPLDLQYIYTGLTLKNQNVIFTIQGDDGKGLPGSIATKTVKMEFMNYMVWGVGATLINGSYVSAKTFLELLLTTNGTKEQTDTRIKTLFGEGDILEKFFVLYPKRFGFATFTKNNLVGGFYRLKNVGGSILVADDDYAYDGDESDILIDNGEEEEAFLIYESTSDNIEDPVTPIKIT